jgi:outer membrane lipoprotein-sorting protein
MNDLNGMSRIVLIAIAVGLLAFSAPENARQIVAEAQHRTQVDSVSYEGQLQITKANGKKSEKHWTVARIGSHGASKTIIRFTDPPEVKGAALLIVNHPEQTSDQWMWTPAVGRERRIASQDRSTRFFDTDFSFEDLEERDVAQYDYELVGEADVDGAPCWLIQAVPKQNKPSQYTSSRLFIRHKDYAIAQVDNYVAKEIVRTFKYQDIRNILGVPTPLVVDVYDSRRRSRTVFRLETIKYNSAMKDEDFTISAIREAK